MSDPDALIPVDILTGFLGAGKTTLIRRLLDRGRLRDTAILVNEFASLPLDQRLIALSGGRAEVIGEGCLCCVVDGNVRDSLIDLADRRQAGSVPAFSRVLIETSGLSDPASLVATLGVDRRLKSRFRLGRVVTLVDLSQGEAAIGDSAEGLSQIICADIVMATKPGFPGGASIGLAGARIGAINPLAQILLDDGLADPFGASLPPGAVPRTSARRFVALPEGRAHARIRSGVLRYRGPVDWPTFATWLSLLAHRHGRHLLRLKGRLTILGDEGLQPILVQSVRHIVHRPEHLPADAAGCDLELVVILDDLDPARLQISLTDFLNRLSPPKLAAAG